MIVQANKTGDDLVAGAFQDNLIVDYAGIAAADLSADQQGQLLGLIAEWVENSDITEGRPGPAAAAQPDRPACDRSQTWPRLTKCSQAFAREVVGRGKRLYTLDDPDSARLLALGARPMQPRSIPSWGHTQRLRQETAPRNRQRE